MYILRSVAVQSAGIGISWRTPKIAYGVSVVLRVEQASTTDTLTWSLEYSSYHVTRSSSFNMSVEALSFQP